MAEIVIGAAAAVGAAGMYKTWELFQTPSLDGVEQLCRKSIPIMGASTKITVWGFEEGGKHPQFQDGIPDDSCYVARVEAFLRLAKQPYVKMASKGGMENPRGKLPFANVQGKMIDDSSKIIDALTKELNITLDNDLTDTQRSTKHLIQQLLQGSLYWVMLHQKFDTEYGRQCFREDLAHQLPPIIRQLVSAMAIRGSRANLHGSGVGRMPHDEILEKGKTDLRCLSQLLGTQNFFFGGTQPTTIDADVYSWLVMFFKERAQIHDPWIEEIKKECPNLVGHTERMKAILYPETVTTE